MKEIWIDIPNHSSYKCSNLGNIKSFKVLSEGKLLSQSLDTKGYKKVRLDGVTYNTHKLVAICFLNHKPNGTNKIVVDHINEDKLDNRASNLRLVSNRYNCNRSNKGNSKYLGVHFDKFSGKWSAQLKHNNKRFWLGRHNSEEKARLAYNNKLKEFKNGKEKQETESEDLQ